MIEVCMIDETRSGALALKNDPFPLWGRMIPSYTDGRWGYTVEEYPPEERTQMCFPDEAYTLDGVHTYVGAFEDGVCIGLAVMKDYWFKYMYVDDLKVCASHRGRGVGRLLIEKCTEVAVSRKYRGLYLVGQDNNLNACLFYLHNGFRIGGLDTEVYRGTSQEGKADILFYLDAQ